MRMTKISHRLVDWRRLAASVATLGLPALGLPTLALGAEPGVPPLGIWLNHSGKGGIETYMCGKYLCGRVVWLRQPLTSSGRPMYDGNNPDPNKRARLICGLTTLTNLKPMTDGSWGDGQAYNPEEGKSYDVSVKLDTPDQLNVTGTVLFFSKTVHWKRAPQQIERCDVALQTPPAAPPGATGAAKPPATSGQAAPAAAKPATPAATPAKSVAPAAVKPAQPAKPTAASPSAAAKPKTAATGTTAVSPAKTTPAKPATANAPATATAPTVKKASNAAGATSTTAKKPAATTAAAKPTAQGAPPAPVPAKKPAAAQTAKAPTTSATAGEVPPVPAN